MTAEQFLDKLEQQGLLDPKDLARLRMQVSQSSSAVTPAALAKLLVDKGRLTPFQAKKMLEQSDGSPVAGSPPPAAAPPASDSVPDELGLAPMDDDPVPASGLSPSASANNDLTLLPDDPTEDAGGLTPLNDEGGLTPIDEGGLTPLDDGGLVPLDDPGMDLVADVIDDGSATGVDLGADGLDSLETPSPLQGGSMHGYTAMPGTTFQGKRVRKRWSDSKWMFIGPTVLVVLVLLVILLNGALSRGTAQELFEAAEDSYRNEAYSEAIERYQVYLDTYPKDDNAGKAKVRMVLARIRQPVASKSWDRALESAAQYLPEVHEEPEFAEARSELRSILPDIADGFAQLALDAEDIDRKQTTVAAAEEAMVLVNDPTNLPTSDRTPVEPRIDSILETIATVHREINREKELTQAISKMQTAVADGRTSDAFAIRTSLLRMYPGLRSNESLKQVALTITERERDLVSVIADESMGESADHPAATEYSVLMANRVGQNVSSLGDELIHVLAGGSVYGLKARTGRIAWRRYVGFETVIQPQVIGDDLLVCDSARQELLRLQGSTGDLIWRLPIGEPFADPVVSRDQIYVATESGRLRLVDPESGNSERHVMLPMPLYCGPAANDDQPYVYQAGEHSNLYALSGPDLECGEVFYLGHKPGSVTVPPIVSRNHILVAENAGVDYSLLHVIATDRQGLKLSSPQEPFHLKGRVVLPPRQLGRRVLVVTDLGQIHFFEVQIGDESAVVEEVLVARAPTPEPTISYPMVDDGQLWFAGRGIAKYDVLFSSGKLDLLWRKNPNDTFIGPMHDLGDAFVHVRRRRGYPGISVSAVSASGDMVWRTDIAVPSVGRPIITESKNSLFVMSAQGNLFRLGQGIMNKGFSDEPTARPSPTEKQLWFTREVDLPEQRRAYTSFGKGNQLLRVNPQSNSEPLRLHEVSPETRTATFAPVSFAGGVLAGTQDGRLLLVDPNSGGDLAVPFQPPVAPGETVSWQQPAVLQDGQEFVISDNRLSLYRVALSDSPESNLTERKRVNLTLEIVSPWAALGNSVYAVAVSREHQFLYGYDAASLELIKEIPLDGHVTWGPQRVDDTILLVTDDERMLCIESGQKIRWETEISYGRPAGSALAHQDGFIFASRLGAVWRVDAATGQQSDVQENLQPCDSGVVVWYDRLCVLASDGTLQVIPDFDVQ